MHDGSYRISIRRLAGALAMIGAASAALPGCASDVKRDPKSPGQETVIEPAARPASAPLPPPVALDAEVHADRVATEGVYDDSDWDVPATDLSLAPAVSTDQGDRVGQRLAFEGELKKRLDAIDERFRMLAPSPELEALKASRSALERERNDLPLCSEEKWPETKARLDAELSSIEGQLTKLEAP